MIKNVGAIGMGALGLLFGSRIHETLGDEHFCFLMDEEKEKKHRGDIYTINGEEKKFPKETPESFSERRETPDLLLVSTKYMGLDSAGDLASKVAGPNTIIISLLNGITSEEILAEKLGRERILDCVAIGMDAMRDGTDLNYKNMGRLQIGEAVSGQKEMLEALTAFFDKVNLPYELPEDIKKSMWVKFMMNVGINQACMVHDATYAEALAPGSIYEEMKAAMHEVMDIAKEEGIIITEEDYENSIAIFRTLNPTGYPSMSQDAVAKRKSEVDLFAGTVMKIAEKHGIPVPVNSKYYDVIKEKESKY